MNGTGGYHFFSQFRVFGSFFLMTVCFVGRSRYAAEKKLK